MEDEDEYTVEEYKAMIDLCHRLYPDKESRHELYNESESKRLKASLIAFATTIIVLFTAFCVYGYSKGNLVLDGLIIGIPCVAILVIVGCYLIYETRNTVYDGGFTFWDNLRD